MLVLELVVIEVPSSRAKRVNSALLIACDGEVMAVGAVVVVSVATVVAVSGNKHSALIRPSTVDRQGLEPVPGPGLVPAGFKPVLPGVGVGLGWLEVIVLLAVHSR